jgi:hypothetical protein
MVRWIFIVLVAAGESYPLNGIQSLQVIMNHSDLDKVIVHNMSPMVRWTFLMTPLPDAFTSVHCEVMKLPAKPHGISNGFGLLVWFVHGWSCVQRYTTWHSLSLFCRILFLCTGKVLYYAMDFYEVFLDVPSET